MKSHKMKRNVIFYILWRTNILIYKLSRKTFLLMCLKNTFFELKNNGKNVYSRKMTTKNDK